MKSKILTILSLKRRIKMANNINWLKKIDAAKELALNENKAILLDFFNPD